MKIFFKSSLYSRHYDKACNECSGPSPQLSTWTTQFRRKCRSSDDSASDLNEHGTEPRPFVPIVMSIFFLHKLFSSPIYCIPKNRILQTANPSQTNHFKIGIHSFPAGCSAFLRCRKMAGYSQASSIIVLLRKRKIFGGAHAVYSPWWISLIKDLQKACSSYEKDQRGFIGCKTRNRIQVDCMKGKRS